MFWQEDDQKDTVTTSEKVVDVCYRIECRQIPASHADELAQALYGALPWLQAEKAAGIHQIHGAESANGWQRPADDALIHLSKRTRMQIRLPVERIEDAGELVGKQLDIAGYPLRVGKMSVKPINPLSTLFARYIAVPEGESEEQFLQKVVDELAGEDIHVRKLLCGRSHRFVVQAQTIFTRSLMVADLDKLASVKLQERGLGTLHHYGCGIFVPHKGIKAVGDTEEKSHFSGV